MNVGVYMGDDITPEAGGAFSLLQTIKREAMGAKTESGQGIVAGGKPNRKTIYRFFIVYRGKGGEPYKTEADGITYINLRAIKDEPLAFKQRLKRKARHILGIKEPHTPAGLKLNIAAERENIEVFYFAHPCCFEGVNIPYIYTVWDLGHRVLPAFPEVSRCKAFEWDGRERMYQTMLPRAVFVLTGNETGKREIFQNYCIPPDKIRIVPFPVADFCHEAEETPDFDLPDDVPYFFYPAQFWPHKNHTVILDALVLLREMYAIVPQVYFTGSDKGNAEYIKSEVTRLGLEGQVHFAGFVSSGVIKYLYTHAAAMVFASLMGPNNMPPIEAISLGCPVIITNIAGHKEQMGDAAMYFDGYRPETLAEAMHTMLADKAARDSLIEKEHHLASAFGGVNYFGHVLEVLDEFATMRRTWNNDDRQNVLRGFDNDAIADKYVKVYTGGMTDRQTDRQTKSKLS